MWILDRLAVSLLGSCDASVSRVEEVLELLRGLELLEDDLLMHLNLELLAQTDVRLDLRSCLLFEALLFLLS